MNEPTLDEQIAYLEKLQSEIDTYPPEIRGYIGEDVILMRAAFLASLERLKAIDASISEMLSDARAACGGDGQGCEVYRGYYDAPERRWQKCDRCRMDDISELASLRG